MKAQIAIIASYSALKQEAHAAVDELGIDPVHLGIVICFNLVLGLITPPVGGVLFAICGVSGLSLEKLSVAVWRPFWKL